jgi:hypothetical protein
MHWSWTKSKQLKSTTKALIHHPAELLQTNLHIPQKYLSKMVEDGFESSRQVPLLPLSCQKLLMGSQILTQIANDNTSMNSTDVQFQEKGPIRLLLNYLID